MDQILEQMVHQPGTTVSLGWDSLDANRALRTSTQLDNYLRKARRFPVEPKAEERLHQLERSTKLLAQVTLSRFAPTNERELEDWVDSASTMWSKLNLCVDLLFMAWRAAATPEIAVRMDSISVPDTCDELVDSIARALFPRSKYWVALTLEIIKPARHTTVLATKNWFERMTTRFTRVIRRWNKYLPIADEFLAISFRAALPLRIAANMELWSESNLITDLEKVAERLEGSMIYESEEAFAAEEVVERTVDRRRSAPSGPPVSSTQVDPKRLRKMKCFCCGKSGHMKSDCPSLPIAFCTNCDRGGHLKSACRMSVRRDESGKVRTTTEQTPSKTAVVVKHDRTRKDFADSNSKIAEMFLKHFNKERAKKRAVPARSNDVMMVEASTVDDLSPDERREMDELMEGFCAFMISPEAADVLQVSITLNDKPCVGLVDTGAKSSLCSRAFAERLGLRGTGMKCLFRGVGSSFGEKLEPVKCVFEHKVAEINLFCFDSLPRDCVLGRETLRQLKVNPDLENNVLNHWDDSEEFSLISDTIMHDEQHTGWVDVGDGETFVPDEVLIARHRETFDKQTKHLDRDPELKEHVWSLFLKHKACWVRPASGHLNAVTASFEVEGKPIKQRLRYMPEEHKKLLEQHLKEMLQRKVIRPSRSEWGFVPVFVTKKDGGWRLCLDYRPLNNRMKGDAYPIPLLWSNVQKAAGNQYYICLDCNWGYWNVPLSEGSKQYTALITHKGTFEFNVLPFGIKTSGSWFQRAIDNVLGHLYHKGVLSYIDDIIIFGNSIEEVLALLDEVLTECVKRGLYLKMAKAQLFCSEVKLLGHVVNASGIRPNPEKIEAVRKAEIPKTKSELRSFLGAASYLRKFVPHFATLASPLIEMTSPRVELTWTEEANQSFEALKDEMCDVTYLAAPRDGQFRIMTDASDVGIGAVLLQVQEDELVILEFASYKFKGVERRWSTREREAYAIVWAVDRFHSYVLAAPFIVYTDHENLRWMHKCSNGKVQRWALKLQQYDMQIKHISGDQNVVADWLSRSFRDDLDDDLVEEIAVPHLVAEKEPLFMVKMWDHEFRPMVPTVKLFKECLEKDDVADQHGTYLSQDGLRYNSRTDKIYVPKGLRESMLWWFHTSRSGGHGGVGATSRRMKRSVWWPKMHRDVSEYVRGCLLCQRKPKAVLRGIRYALSRPAAFELVSLDWIGPEVIKGVAHYILVIIDHATRFVLAESSLAATAEISREIFERVWCSIFSAPKAVLTDRGTHFRAVFNEFVVGTLGAYHVLSSPYYPQGNSINEACHGALKRSVAAILRDTDDVRMAVRDAVKIHNATPHVALGMSPYYMMFGHEMCFPGWQAFRQTHDTKKVRYMRDEVWFRKHLKDRMQQELSNYEAPATGHGFVIGDWLVYELSSEEARHHSHPVSSSMSMSAHMSLPCKVLEIRDKMLLVAMLGMPQHRRDVPVALCRKLKTEIPVSLQKVALEQIQFEAPRIPLSVGVRQHDDSKPVSWEDLTSRVNTVKVGRRHQ